MLNYFNIKTKISQLNSKKKLEKYQNQVKIRLNLNKSKINLQSSIYYGNYKKRNNWEKELHCYYQHEDFKCDCTLKVNFEALLPRVSDKEISSYSVYCSATDKDYIFLCRMS